MLHAGLVAGERHEGVTGQQKIGGARARCEGVMEGARVGEQDGVSAGARPEQVMWGQKAIRRAVANAESEVQKPSGMKRERQMLQT